jgi:hypothetical protein
VCGPLLGPLVAMLADPAERCRAGALQLLLGAAGAAPDLRPLLPALLGALAARLGQAPSQEPAEELRLQAAELVGRVSARAPPAALAAHARELCAVLAAGLADPYPEARKASAAALAVLASRAPPEALEPHAERLLQARGWRRGAAAARLRGLRRVLRV